MPRRAKFQLEEFIPKEHDEQVSVCDALTRMHLVFYAVPNYRPLDGNWPLYNYLLAEGMQPGVPDLVICEPVGCYHGMYVEMKRRKKGKLTANQIDWAARLRAKGYYVLTGDLGASAVIVQVQRYIAGQVP